MKYTCSTCKLTKDEEAFGISNTHATGRNPRCKECCNKAAKKILARKRHNNSTELLERIISLEKRLAAIESVAQFVTLLTTNNTEAV